MATARDGSIGDDVQLQATLAGLVRRGNELRLERERIDAELRHIEKTVEGLAGLLGVDPSKPADHRGTPITRRSPVLSVVLSTMNTGLAERVVWTAEDVWSSMTDIEKQGVADNPRDGIYAVRNSLARAAKSEPPFTERVAQGRYQLTKAGRNGPARSDTSKLMP